MSGSVVALLGLHALLLWRAIAVDEHELFHMLGKEKLPPARDDIS